MRRSSRTVLSVATALSLCVTFAVGASATAPAPVTPVGDVAQRPTPPPPPGPDTSGTLAPTPPMGFNNWNAFGCGVTAELIKETADAFVSSGLKARGYQYINIDDCWSLRERGADGRLVPDPAKFPDGIKGVADYVHSLGLKLGIYGDAGTKTCSGFPGSLGTEDLDAQTWAEWGVDYLKYDNCYNQSDGSRADFVRRYTAMRTALDKVDRPIVFSMCEWGQSQPWEWATGVADLWRTSGDISDNWTTMRGIIAHNVTLSAFAGPGHWNDPDMLEIGNGGMTDTEYRTHMSMWSMMAAPLIMGTDVRTASAATLAILENAEIVAIDQDRLGKQATVVSDTDGLMVLDKPLAGGDHAIALYNASDALATISAPVSSLGLRPAKSYRLQDLWSGAVLQAKSTISAAVPAHGTVVYRVRPAAPRDVLAPSVTVGGTVGTLIPGPDGTTTLDATVTNRGDGPITTVAVTVQGPAGWTIASTSPTTRRDLRTDASLATAWTVEVPDGTAAGRYPLTLTATYEWGRHQSASSTSELIGTVVVAPADGLRHLSTVPWVSAANAVGPVELDQSVGGAGEGDGTLITIGGKVYTRGLGTHAASKIVYYLGGRCTSLTTDVGIDDTVTADGAATFRVLADDTVVADSGERGVNDPATTLTADLTGATWLTLVTDPGVSNTGANDQGDSTDWARPVLACGTTSPGDPVLPVERTLYSFETGTDGWAPVNATTGNALAQSSAFATDGAYGLEVTTPVDGNWYGQYLTNPLDLTGSTVLKFDVQTAANGTSGEFAVQVGDSNDWCQGGHWAWTNPYSSRTIATKIADISCSAGVTLDLSKVHAVYVFVNGRTVVIDNVRAE